MRTRQKPLFTISLSLAAGVIGIQLVDRAAGSVAAREPSEQEQIAFFDSQVHPILETHCYRCHGAEEKLKGNLRLTSRAGLIQGGDQGPAINLQDLPQSLLLQMISYQDDDHQMPPKSKLPQQSIQVLSQWVLSGAPYNPDREISGHSKPSKFNTEVNEKTKNYWCFRPIDQPALPVIGASEWSKNPIDAFIYQRLADEGLQPNPPATRLHLIRRAYYDLTGLPPSPEQVAAFAADSSPEAFERIVDQLLASPHYGEKWGRHWLDLVRYAETNGYERDGPKAFAWRYRDYVIQSFNEDKPYDQFVMEQLAGDELDLVTPTSLIATGYHRLGIWDDEPVDADQAFFDSLDWSS